MLFREAISAAKLGIKLQVFASDVDPDAIATAREGLYPETIDADVSPERIARFFSKEDRSYRVSPELRAAVVFTVQDVLADPPFSRLDFVSCRNLLIYLRPEAQAKVLALFHFALRTRRHPAAWHIGDNRRQRRPLRGRIQAGASLSAHRPQPPRAVRTSSRPRRWRARPSGDHDRPLALASGQPGGVVPTDGDGDLCAGGGSDQPQA